MTQSPTTPSGPEQDTSQRRQKRLEGIIELISVILLSITALVTAWSAYQATNWGTAMTINFSQASTKRVLATRASTAAGQLTTLDVNLFTNWLNAYADDDQRLVQFYEDRFRAEFKPAFQAWMATDPRTNSEAPKSPFAMAEYQVSQAQEAARLDEEAALLYDQGLAANDKRDGYALTTVLLASVLFFVGMSQRMKSNTLRATMVIVGALVFLVAVIRVSTLMLG